MGLGVKGKASNEENDERVFGNSQANARRIPPLHDLGLSVTIHAKRNDRQVRERDPRGPELLAKLRDACAEDALDGVLDRLGRADHGVPRLELASGQSATIFMPRSDETV